MLSSFHTFHTITKHSVPVLELNQYVHLVIIYTFFVVAVFLLFFNEAELVLPKVKVLLFGNHCDNDKISGPDKNENAWPALGLSSIL